MKNKEKIAKQRKANKRKTNILSSGNQYQKEYYILNKEKIKKYYQRNKKKILTNRKKYIQVNKEKISQYQKDWQLNNKEYFKEYYLNNKEIFKERNKGYRGKNKICTQKCAAELTPDYYAVNREWVKKIKKGMGF